MSRFPPQFPASRGNLLKPRPALEHWMRQRESISKSNPSSETESKTEITSKDLKPLSQDVKM